MPVIAVPVPVPVPQLLLLVVLLAIGGCGTTSEVSSAPFDLSSTTGDAASSTSSNEDDDDESARAEHFLATQGTWIRREAAAGGGEHIDALARLIGEPDAASLGRWLQQNHAQVFDDRRQPADMLVLMRQRS